MSSGLSLTRSVRFDLSVQKPNAGYSTHRDEVLIRNTCDGKCPSLSVSLSLSLSLSLSFSFHVCFRIPLEVALVFPYDASLNLVNALRTRTKQ